MFVTVYVYRVADDHVDRVLEINAAASARYVELGALDDQTLATVDAGPKYGCAGLAELIEVAEGEQLFFGLATFRDAEHHAEVMAAVDADPIIDDLFAQMTDVVDLTRFVRADFASPG